MKVSISIPDELFEKAETAAGHLHVSRSKLYTMALRHYFNSGYEEDIIVRLNSFYETHDSRLDPALAKMQSLSLEHSEWKDEL